MSRRFDSSPQNSQTENVLRIKPFHYIHVTDTNTNVTRIETGPKTFTKSEHEKVILGPVEMIKIPPRSWVKISSPVIRNKEGKVSLDKHGNVRVRYGDEEIRFTQAPFPLYPGESFVGRISPLQVVEPETALRLKALRDFTDDQGHKRVSGDEWYFHGPDTYTPRVEVSVVDTVHSQIILFQQGLLLKARNDTLDQNNVKRKAGEMWLIRNEGSYLVGVDEELVSTVKAHILTETQAIALRARRTFTDVYGKQRKAGEEWLVTSEMSETHLPDVYEEFIGPVGVTVLSKRQYCIVMDPIVKGKQHLGQKDLRKGPGSFFLQPSERLENGIQNVVILGEQEALLLRAKSSFKDGDKQRQAGDRWMVYGPSDFVPAVEVELLENRKTIALDDNEGIYVRDTKSGSVRAVCGQSYLLQPHEELWQKELNPTVEAILDKNAAGSGSSAGSNKRDRTRVVTYRVPHNAAVQIYDYKENKSRVVFGPDLIMLSPEEQFTVLSLSGSKPKRPHVIKDIALLLGPEFSTDIVKVETVDHARLAIQVSYNWHFERATDKQQQQEEGSKFFCVPDFIGDMCKDIASRIRGSVAACYFEYFHKNSAKVIRSAVFGTENGKIKDSLRFSENGLVVTNIDIQSVEPIDHRTRDSLQKSVQLAIEITTNSQEATAKHAALKLEQEAKGRLETQKIADEASAEEAKTQLLRLQAQSASVEISGQTTAEAAARSKAAEIESTAAVKLAQLRADALKLKNQQELEALKSRNKLEVQHQQALNELEISQSKQLSDIDSQKFTDIVQCIGAGTIKSISQAGPELQAKLLQGLGLQSFMITDGSSPINLFNTAQGLIQQNSSNAAAASPSASPSVHSDFDQE